ncbi:MAG: hypothetical protein RR614_11290 [Eubacterium sp.]
MTVGYQEDGLAHVVNGLARPIEVFGGEVFIIWVCSRQCTSCDKHQRMLPEAVKPWMRYALTVVAHVLFTLFEPEAFRGCHPLKGKTRRSFNALDFYGETSTIYRWRRRFAAAG